MSPTSRVTSSPKIIRTVSELVQWRRSTQQKIGLFATMGALHEGHASVLRKIRPRCEVSVLSIYVNPTQFGPKEDFSRYPRSLENDLKIAAQEGVDIVFVPESSEIYPAGYSTYIEETQLSQPLCGKYRPAFFRGVATVVLKLFHLVRPDLTLFGLKDAQQFFVVSKMVHDLNLDLKVEGAATVRESDGLALSSRNAYLSTEEREKAPLIYRELSRVRDELVGASAQDQRSKNELREILESAKNRLEKQGFQVQYLDCLELPLLNTPSTYISGHPYLVAIAAFLGSTRLIDNVILNPEKLRGQILNE